MPIECCRSASTPTRVALLSATVTIVHTGGSKTAVLLIRSVEPLTDSVIKRS